MPPHNLDAEAAVLGAMLLSRDALADAVEGCDAGDFYSPHHARIFEACVALYAAGEPVDVATVADDLGRAGLLDQVGGPAALSGLQVQAPSTAHAGRYAAIVAEHATLRRLIVAGGEVAELGYSTPDDVEAAVDRAEQVVYRVADARRGGETTRRVQDLLGESLDQIEARYNAGDTVTGVPTGYIDLDEVLGGLQPSSLTIVGARPAVGKTAWALGAAAHASMDAGVPTLVFSLEMSHMELTQRLLCAEARVDSQRTKTGRLLESDWAKLSRAVGRLGEAPLYIDDDPHLTVMDIRAKARRMKASAGGLGLVVIDYLQLMAGRGGAENRQVEISELSRGLKVLARELQVPIVALSQLSRNLEMRADKRPMLADLRESGSLEQDSDVVLFLFRSEVYDPESPDRGMAEVIVAKHRNGPTGVARLAFLEHCTKFTNMARVAA